jgi:hypothetical protein
VEKKVFSPNPIQLDSTQSPGIASSPLRGFLAMTFFKLLTHNLFSKYFRISLAFGLRALYIVEGLDEHLWAGYRVWGIGYSVEDGASLIENWERNLSIRSVISFFWKSIMNSCCNKWRNWRFFDSIHEREKNTHRLWRGLGMGFRV